MRVNRAWTEFAIKNGAGKEMNPEVVLGTNFWSAFSDPTTLELYQKMVGLARQGKVIEFSYRCDAPDFRRVFVMRIEQAGLEVAFCSTLVREEKRMTVSFLEAGQMRSSETIRMCSWCQKVAGREGDWMSVENAVERLRLMEMHPPPHISHGICERCAQRMYGILGDSAGTTS